MSIRDPLTDHLLTPQNCALLIIDFQPPQVNTVRSIDPGELVAAAPAHSQSRALDRSNEHQRLGRRRI